MIEFSVLRLRNCFKTYSSRNAYFAKQVIYRRNGLYGYNFFLKMTVKQVLKQLLRTVILFQMTASFGIKSSLLVLFVTEPRLQLILEHLPEFFYLRPYHKAAVRLRAMLIVIILMVTLGLVKFRQWLNVGYDGAVESTRGI